MYIIALRASLVAQMVKNPPAKKKKKNPPAMRETWVPSLGWGSSPAVPGEGNSILAWRIPQTV